MRNFSKMDKTLLTLTVIMFIFGLFMIYSVSSVQDGFYYFNKQLISLSMGLFVSAIFIIKMSMKQMTGLINLGFFATVALLFIVLFFGTPINNAKSWLFFGGFSLQPSEVAKLMLILFWAVTIPKYIAQKKYIEGLVRVLTATMFVVGLTFFQPDLGTATIIAFIAAILFFATPIPFNIKKNLTLAIALIVVMGVLIFVFSKGGFLNSMQSSRLDFKDPCSKYQGDGYQTCNGLIAINSGELLPTKIGQSKQKYSYLPEAHNDFIFPIIVEETGLLISLLLIFIYLVIIIRIIKIGYRSYELRNRLVCFGIAAYVLVHILVNLSGVFVLIPLTGVPLPFLSYGGTYTLVLVMAMAFVQRVNIENNIHEQQKLINQR